LGLGSVVKDKHTMFTGVVMAGTQYLYGATRYGVANCPVSGMDSLSRLFKPYMQFDGGRWKDLPQLGPRIELQD
jgi:hypothetical protein